MKLIVLVLGLVVLTLGQQQQIQRGQRRQQPQGQRQLQGRALEQPEVLILRNEIDHGENGAFRYAWETSDGSAAEQQGGLKNIGTENEGLAVTGSYQYYTPEGQLIRVTYTADENGFRPQGEHLPTSPPIPEAIQRSLDLIYRNADIQRAQAAAAQQQLPQQQPQFQQQAQFRSAERPFLRGGARNSRRQN